MKALIILSIIAIIESSNGVKMYNSKSGAIGKYQITKIVVKEWSKYHSKKYKAEDLWKDNVNEKIADWYLNKRIPEMLRYYRYKASVENILMCYNWGIGNFLKYKKGKKRLPKETKRYLEKYRKLLKERR